jgi:hypothetical protein
VFQNNRVTAMFRALDAYGRAAKTWHLLPQILISRHGLAGE